MGDGCYYYFSANNMMSHKFVLWVSCIIVSMERYLTMSCVYSKLLNLLENKTISFRKSIKYNYLT